VSVVVELCVELVDVLQVGCESLVVECSVMGERERGATEVGEGEGELVPEFGIGVGLQGVGLAGGVWAGGGVGLAAERVEVEDVSAGGFVRPLVELIERAIGLRDVEVRHLKSFVVWL
jgi:hypothetical protein